MVTSLARMPTVRFWVALLVIVSHYPRSALAELDADTSAELPVTSTDTSETDLDSTPSDSDGATLPLEANSAVAPSEPESSTLRDEEPSPLEEKNAHSSEESQSEQGASKSQGPAYAPQSASPVPRKVVGDQATGFAKRTIGALGLMTIEGPEGVHAGGALHVRGVALLYGPIVSARYLESHWIGHDTFGTTYSLNAQMGIGARWELFPNHGPFVRADVRGEVTRLGGFRYSSLRLPGIQLGYSLDQGKWLIDTFGHAGLSLTGRVRHPGFTRPVKGAFVGGALSLGFDNWLLHTDVSHLLHFGGPFWDVRSSLCSYWGRKPTLLARTRRVAENVGPRSTMGALTVDEQTETILER